MDDKVKARQLYFDFGCNTQFMVRDGYYIEVSKEDEDTWRKEYVDYVLDQVAQNDFSALYKLAELKEICQLALPRLLDFAFNGDSWEKILYVDALEKILSQGKPLTSPDVIKQTRSVAIQVCHSILEEPFILRSQSRAELESMSHLFKGLNSVLKDGHRFPEPEAEKMIKSRAVQSLQNLNKFL